ncbi:AMP-dependent synthetase/ligase [Frankia sp. Cpl3]|uniref:AMP-dependent synthetase/ligase n=1 Tax=Parafrankia colletiae TaxID=573497 RepID=UPI000AC3FD9F|nr:AMP-dependent synthetase/ligase [Parafrankia colletiae]MCK9904028.1 AMP-dependent synthetase/ligase [Frankia sp. Cpl3]
MSQYTLGAGLVLPDDRGLYSLVHDRAQTTPELVALSRPVAAGWADVTYRDLDAHVRQAAGGLLRAGVEAGDRVGLLGRTSYEWVVADLAVLAVGAVTVPIFPTASAVQVAHIVTDSGMRWCFVETAEHLELVTAAAGGALHTAPWPLADLDGWGAATGGDPAGTAEFTRRRDAVRAGSLATIVYTSGTTGMPKGCMLTHGNLFASSANTVEHTGDLFRLAGDGGGQASTLLCLPLAHVFGRTILVACLYAGTRTGLLPAVTELLPAMATFRPSVLALVPYGLEKIRKGLRRAIDTDTELAAVATGLAAATAVAAAGDNTSGGADGNGDGSPVRLTSRPDPAALARASAVFGGRLTHVISGGASLDTTTAAYYRGLGVEILNCYGLTEAATAVTVNQPATNRPGTVGQPIPGTTVAIADDGEVLVAGPNVSPGYWRAGQDPSEVAAAGDPGWLHTGDLGRLDADGFLVITGRRKEILVTSGGKNVTPTLLEDRLRLHPLVADAMVIGEARPYVAALFTLEPAALRALADTAGSADTAGIDLDADGWWEHPGLLDRLREAVDDANGLVSRAESIRRIRVLPDQFTIDAGHLTPSMKLRRAQIEAAFAAEIEELYAAAPPAVASVPATVPAATAASTPA